MLMVSGTAFLVACASIGNPQGGPKDTKPPVVVKSSPEAFSTNFSGNKIEIEFNEYVQLKEVKQLFMTSPPMQKQPDITMRGKKVVVKFEEEFRKDVTYSMKFFNTISDFNEGNILKDYEFVVATGNQIDTLQVYGHVWDSQTLKPMENMFVMIYSDLTDSIPAKSLPDYITTTDKTGKWSIRNIASGKYKIFALSDANMNKKLDLADGAIAFSTSFFEPKASWKSSTDTLVVDSTKVNDKYVYRDTVITSKKIVYTPDSIRLRAFTEKSDLQFVESITRPEKGKLSFIFKNSLGKNDKLIPMNFTKNAKTVAEEYSINRDSVTWWITDSLVYKLDTIKIKFNYLGLDTANKQIEIADTLLFGFDFAELLEIQSNRKKKEDKKSALGVYFETGNANMLDIGRQPFISFDRPVTIMDKSLISLMELVEKDKTEKNIPITLESTSAANRKFKVNVALNEGAKYKLVVDSAAVRDIYDNVNDSTGVRFSLITKKFYGTLILDLKNIKSQTIIHLNTAKGLPAKELVVTKDGKYTIENVMPGDYFLKAIVDTNKNGKWDTGIYYKKLQPETVKMKAGKVAVRGNWDTTIEWDLK